MSWTQETARIQWETLATRAFTLLNKELGSSANRAVSELLYKFYRWLSTWQLHGGAGVLVNLIEFDGDTARVSRRGKRDRAVPMIKIGAIFVGTLALLIVAKRGGDTGSIENQLHPMLEGSTLRDSIADIVEEG